MQPARASAPGKLILFGEHAVVHGQPALAVPLSAVRVTVQADPATPGSGLAVHAPEAGHTLQIDSGPEPPPSPLHNALGHPLRVALGALDCPPPDLHLTVRSTIPIASGLGSGAALAAALIRALGAALECPFDDQALNALVYEVERRHHGTPSGIDNTVIVFEQPVYFVRGEPLATFAIARPFTLLVADTGQPSPTHIAVADVRRLYAAEPERTGAVFARIGQIARAARAAIESGTIESLGPLMDENHALLADLTVSSATLDRLCTAARAAGATGAKLSGGGRGGNLIALVDDESAGPVTAALHRAGAARVIQTTVS